MKLMIEVGGSYLGLEAGKDVGAIISALTGAAIYRKNYGSGPEKWTLTGTAEESGSIGLEIVPDNALTPPTPAMDAMCAAVKQAEARWMEYYTRATKAEKELKELKVQLASIQGKPADDGGKA